MTDRESLRDTFLSRATEYDEARPNYPREFGDAVAGGDGARLRVLEIGAGSGLATQGYAARVASVVALDPSAEALAIALQRMEGVASIEYVAASFEATTFDPGAFDVVVAAQSLHWLTEPESAVRKVANLLRPSGRIVLAWNFIEYGADERLSSVRRAIIESVDGFRRLPEGEDGSIEAYGIQWRALLISESFCAAQLRVVPTTWSRSPEQLLAWLETMSWYRVLPPPTQRVLRSRVRGILGDSPVACPIRTILVTATRPEVV